MNAAMKQTSPAPESENSRTRGETRVSICAMLMLVPLMLQTHVTGAQEADEQEADEQAADEQAADEQAADEQAAAVVDTSKWKCKFCEFEEGWSSEFNLGLGHVSDDSYKFGEYNGLYEEGTYLIGDARLEYRNEHASYLDLTISDAGLDSRSLSIEGGRQGSYSIYLRYDELPHFISDSASTPYRGNGGDDLDLPNGWDRAGSTAGMTALGQTLRETDLETQRKRLGIGFSIATASPWSYGIDVQRDDKEGTKRTGGSFFFNTAQLVEPVDYVTEEITATVSYTKKQWQTRLAYYISTFTNQNEALTWENAFTPIVAGADEGQLALPPDNEFQQLSLSAAYKINDRNHLSGDFAVGRMEQNERLLQATLNQDLTLVVPALPTDSVDAKVDTTNAKLKFVSMMTDRLRLSANYSYDDRDNRTPQLTYDWVTTDAFLATQRTNLPYSYTRSAFKIKADYDYVKGTRLGVGYDWDERERTFQEVDETNEDTLWGTIRVRNIDSLFFEFKIARSSRDASTSEVVAAIDPPQNVLMSKYNMADRERDLIAAFASFSPHPNYTVGFAIDHARDDFDESELGLSKSSDNSINIDLTAMLSTATSVSVFLGRQNIQSSQAGSQAFADADWNADIDDTFDNFGISLSYILIEDKLDIGVDYSNSRSRGEIEMNPGVSAEAFPDLRTDLETTKLYLNYRVDENLSLRAAYWHETYDSSDWALDDVAPDTVPNLLGFGELSPSYSIDVIKLSMGYRF